ncbi:MAG TPA: ABC transporter ATP-binding protein [Verrucomicrobiae bacterium]|nr:ABC transporter ATP-binding protein [Verrucomicrobiae bacterium]
MGRHRALDDVTLEIPAGEIFGLLGHNGAGKSTLFGLLLGQLRPTRGAAFIRGISVQRQRLRALQGVGAIFETPAFFDYLSGWNNLRNLLAYSGPVSRAEIEDVVRFVGLENRIHEPVRVYSHGMKQRLALAQALLPRPDVVLLDEPAQGLDPEGIQEMRRLILQLNREHGMTVLLSSHLLAEVEQLCTGVAILNQGRLVFQGHWSELVQAKKQFRLRLNDWEMARTAMEKCGAILVGREIVELRAETEIADLIAGLVRSGVRIHAVEPLREDLEQLYLRKVSGR